MLIYRNVAMVMVATLFLQAAMGALGVALPLAMSGAGWGRPAIGAVIAAFGAGFALGAWSISWSASASVPILQRAKARRYCALTSWLFFAGGLGAIGFGLAHCCMRQSSS